MQSRCSAGPTSAPASTVSGLGAANSSIPPARTCDSISGSPPSWLLANTVTFSRPDDCAPIALAASVRRIVSGWVSGVLTPSLNSNSAAAWAGLPRMLRGPSGGSRAAAAPAGHRRCFHYCFSPGRGSAPGPSFGRTGPIRKPGDETDPAAPRNHFAGTHETIPKQTGRKPSGQQTAHRRLGGIT